MICKRNNDRMDFKLNDPINAKHDIVYKHIQMKKIAVQKTSLSILLCRFSINFIIHRSRSLQHLILFDRHGRKVSKHSILGPSQ